MSDPRTLLVRLRAADASLARERLRPRAVRRIRRRMTKAMARPATSRWGWIPMATFVAGAALVLAVLTVGRRPEPRVVAPSVSVVANVPRPLGVDCRWNDHGPLQMEGACEVTLETPPVRVHTLEGTRVSIDGHRAVLERGGALFEVAPLEDSSFEVSVPSGTITVVGTRFQVRVDGDDGHVELFEGIIDFTPRSGERVRLEAGQRIDFGLQDSSSEVVEDEEPAARTPPKREASAGHRRKASHPSRSVAGLIDEVAALRARGEYRAAAARLEAALAESGWDRRAAEVLSFELGTILTRHIGDATRACRHWSAHLERFDGTRYHEAISRHRSQLGCTGSNR